jgi:glycosyltransferase involved in cell wall biosynthesis
MVATEEDRERVGALIGRDRVTWLRRGIDKRLFHPDRRDRARLDREFGVPPDRPLVLNVGRLDPSKSPLTLARALRALIDAGRPVHAMFCGDGPDREVIRQIMGPAASLPGILPQAILARIYPCADVFAFPSRTDIAPNGVLEARASGLPVVLTRAVGGAQFVERDGVDGMLLDWQGPGPWTDAIGALVAEPSRRRAMGQAARRWVEQDWPSWREVVGQDLVPVWRAAAEATVAP